MGEGTGTAATTNQHGSSNQGNGATNQGFQGGTGQGDGRSESGRNGSAISDGNTAKQEPPRKYQFKGIKIGNREVDWEGDENEVKKRIQQGHGANAAYAEAKRIREEAEQKHVEYLNWKRNQDEYKKSITKDPLLAIRKAVQEAIDAGVDPERARAAGEQWVLENIKRDEESPEAKRARLAEEKLAAKEEEDAKRAEVDRERQLAAAAEEEKKKIVPEMIRQMEAIGMARTAANISAIARKLKTASDRGVPLTIERAAQVQHEENGAYVKSTVGGQAKAINDAFKANDYDTVLKVGREVDSFLGEEVLVALQRYGIVKWKTKSPNMPHQAIDTAKSKTAEETQEMTSKEEEIEARRKRAAEFDRRQKGAVT